MTVRRSARADFHCRADEVATHVRAVLASGADYRHTAEIERGRLFETVVRPSLWLLGTRLQIRLEDHGDSTSVACETISQWFIAGDAFNYYRRYLHTFLDALTSAIAGSALSGSR
jgi:hypothetical protein